MTVRDTHIHPNNDKLILGHDIYDYNCTHPRVSQFTQWLLGGFRGPIFSRGMPWSEGYRSVEIWMFGGLTGFNGPSEVLLWPVSSTACDRECPVFLWCMLLDVAWCWLMIIDSFVFCVECHIFYISKGCANNFLLSTFAALCSSCMLAENSRKSQCARLEAMFICAFLAIAIPSLAEGNCEAYDTWFLWQVVT